MKHLHGIVWILFLVSGHVQSESTTATPKKGNANANDKDSAKTKVVSGGSCYKGDLVCEKDKLGYEAIATLHHQMDDDKNGDIDLEESAEFLLEELQYSKSHWSEHRSKTFHMNDTHITVDDLWMIWKNSSVHNWTVEEAISWLTYDVELPQYVDTFRMNAVDGSTLPRLAVNNLNFVSNILGIKNLVHKQKLANKATDVVLFGPPKSRHNWYKDVALVTAIVVAAGGCWLAYRQNKQLEENMAKTMRDMDSLARSEEALKSLQERLTCEETEKRKHIEHKEQLEEKVKREVSEAKLEAHRLKLTHEQTETQLSQMKVIQQELDQTRRALEMARKELAVRGSFTPSQELQRWLQITFELELKAYNEKKALAEQQLLNAKESCERLRRKKQALFGSLRMAHSGYIDETENIILTAKKALEEVKHDLSERQYRWQQIENLCEFSIISNQGIGALIHQTGHADLYRYCHGGKLLDTSSGPDMDDFEDIPPTYGSVVAGPSSSSSRLSTLRQKMRNNQDGVSSAAASSVGEGSSRGGSEEKGTAPAQRRSSDEQSVDLQSVTSANQMITSANGDAASSHDVLSDESAIEQPNFSLYPEDQESTSSSGSGSNINDNSSIPSRSRPPLIREVAVRQATDAASVCSEMVVSSRVSENTMRARSHTNESLNTFRPARANTHQGISSLVTDSLSASGSDLNHGERGYNGAIKRSQTTGSQQFSSSNNRDKLDNSLDTFNYPESAPASLNRALNDDFDTAVGSGSIESLTNGKKLKKRSNIFKIFKPKQRSA